jgi:hypothetical protein
VHPANARPSITITKVESIFIVDHARIFVSFIFLCRDARVCGVSSGRAVCWGSAAGLNGMQSAFDVYLRDPA